MIALRPYHVRPYVQRPPLDFLSSTKTSPN